jgi:hypothetical protein
VGAPNLDGKTDVTPHAFLSGGQIVILEIRKKRAKRVRRGMRHPSSVPRFS